MSLISNRILLYREHLVSGGMGSYELCPSSYEKMNEFHDTFLRDTGSMPSHLSEILR